MNETAFRELLVTEGYGGPTVFAMAADAAADAHVHDVDIIAMVVEGSITIAKPSGNITYGVGDTFGYAAGELHAENGSLQGVWALVGRRKPVKADTP